MCTVLVIFAFFWTDNDLLCAPQPPKWYWLIGINHTLATPQLRHTLAHSEKTASTIFMKLRDSVWNNIRVTNLHYQKKHDFCCFVPGDPLLKYYQTQMYTLSLWKRRICSNTHQNKNYMRLIRPFRMNVWWTLLNIILFIRVLQLLTRS